MCGSGERGGGDGAIGVLGVNRGRVCAPGWAGSHFQARVEVETQWEAVSRWVIREWGMEQRRKAGISPATECVRYVACVDRCVSGRRATLDRKMEDFSMDGTARFWLRVRTTVAGARCEPNPPRVSVADGGRRQAGRPQGCTPRSLGMFVLPVQERGFSSGLFSCALWAGLTAR